MSVDSGVIIYNIDNDLLDSGDLESFWLHSIYMFNI